MTRERASAGVVFRTRHRYRSDRVGTYPTHNQRHVRRRRLALVPEERDAAARARGALPGRRRTTRPAVRSAGDDLVRFLRGHEKAITGLEVLDQALFSAVPELRIVSKYGVGLDMIDLAAAKRSGVSVRWTRGVNRQAVAELAIAFMLALGRSTVTLAREMRDGGWRQPGGRQLSSAHRSASSAAAHRSAGGAAVRRIRRAHSRARHPRLRRVLSRARRDALSLETLLTQSDFVTIHLPLDASTRGLIGAREIGG